MLPFVADEEVLLCAFSCHGSLEWHLSDQSDLKKDRYLDVHAALLPCGLRHAKHGLYTFDNYIQQDVLTRREIYEYCTIDVKI